MVPAVSTHAGGLAQALGVLANAAIVAASAAGEIVFFNAGAAKLLGYREGEVIGRRMASAWFLDAERNAQHCVWIAKDGHPVPVLLSVTAIPNEGGFAGLAVPADDQRFERALRGANDGVFDIDLLTGEVYRSDRWFELVGHSPEHLEPAYDAFARLLHPDDRDRVWASIQANIAGTALRHDLEFRVRSSSGEYRWFRGRGMTERDARGHPVRFSGSITDITERKGLEQRLEHALRESSEMLRTLVQAAPLAVVSVDRQGLVTSWNPAAERMFGYSEQEALGRLSPAIPPEQLDEFKRLFNTVLDGHTSLAAERTRRAKDGSPLDVSISIAPLRDSSGCISGAITVAQDITDRKRAEKALRESEERYRRFADSCPEAIWVRRDKTIIYVNPACCRLFGAPNPDAMIGRSSLDFVHPDYRAYIDGPATERLARGEAAEASGKLIRFDGEVRDIIVTATSFTLAGEPAVQAVMRDQTARLEAERKLQESERRYRRFVEITNDAMLVHKDLSIVFVNPAACRLFGAAHESQLIGMSIFDLFHPDCHDLVRARARRILEADETVPPIELPAVRLDGRAVQVEASANRYNDRGDMAIQSVLHDLTRRRRAMEEIRDMSQRLVTAQEDESRRIGRELHDGLSQQLAALAMDIGRAVADPPSGSGAALEYLRSIQKRVGRLSEETRGISHRLHPQILDDLGLSDAVESLCIEFEEREEIPVEFEAGSLPPALKSEISSCLYRVAQEGLRNISRHARASSVSVKLDSGGETVSLSIEDNGAGFDPASHPTGLGLHSLRERVRLVNGEIRFASSPGCGTGIFVRVPLPREAS
ncbi:MAG: PAS domain S-box protein [Bryobacteraceae bacterium]